MSDLFGTQVEVEVRINKKTGRYTVKILDHGEQIGCTILDTDGESLNSKIVKYLSEQMGSTVEEGLTKAGEIETRQGAVTSNPLNEDEEEEGYDPLSEGSTLSPWDSGGYGI